MPQAWAPGQPGAPACKQAGSQGAPMPRGLTWTISMVTPAAPYPGHEPEGSLAPGSLPRGVLALAEPATLPGS